MAEPILSLRGVSKSYGPLQVLRKVDLDVYAGEVVALLGENGAGKSTLSGIIAGSGTPFEGEMSWLGQPYAPASPREAINKGLVLIHQELKLLPELSIAENVFVGRWPMKGGRVDRAAMVERAQEQLARLNLRLPATRKVQGLSTAQQQLVEIAKALALNAKLLILDEPTAALGGAETQALFEQVRKLRAEGVGIIYISHRLEEIRQITDRIVVLRDGERVADFADSTTPVRTVVESMVGRSLERMFPPIPQPKAHVVLEVRGLTGANGAFRDVSFSVAEGEILGIAGLVGAGRTELVRAIAGADPVSDGTIWLNGRELNLTKSRRRHRRGHRHGARGSQAPGPHRRASDWREHRLREPRQGRARRLDHEIHCDRLRQWGHQEVRGEGARRAARLEPVWRQPTKGGDRQVARARSPRGHPRRAHPRHGRRRPMGIYDIIVGLAEQGVAVVVVSSDLEEVLGVSNRIVVLAQGKQAGILNRADANDVSVMELATI